METAVLGLPAAHEQQREYPEFCVSEPYLSKGEKYGDQERDFRRVIEG